MVAACSGWRSAAQANRERMAASRLLRVRGLLPRPLFEVVQERGDQRGVEVGDVELAGVLAGALGGEGQQQPPGVPVAGDGVAAGAALADEPVGEECLQRRRERGHRGWFPGEAGGGQLHQFRDGGQVPVIPISE